MRSDGAVAPVPLNRAVTMPPGLAVTARAPDTAPDSDGRYWMPTVQRPELPGMGTPLQVSETFTKSPEPVSVTAGAPDCMLPELVTVNVIVSAAEPSS